jgi:outer membrane protein OmpA-like peptidoglycan-associated protein
MVTNEPCFARYRATPVVKIEFVADADAAHSNVKAYKMPPDTSRMRSEVSGHGAVLESRDPTDPEAHTVAPADVVRQAGPFDFDSSAVNPDVEADVQDAASAMRTHLEPGKTEQGFKPDACLTFTGRASSEGGSLYNEKLGERRADAVRDRLYDVLGVDAMKVRHSEIALLTGERNATTDPKFRRVDITLTLQCGASLTENQNVAAHEFGHMIGLGDEYVDETPPSGVTPKFLGDKPSHYGDVEAAMGTDAANELLVQNSGSIMASGGDVKRGHYVYFLQAITRVTGKSWTVA